MIGALRSAVGAAAAARRCTPLLQRRCAAAAPLTLSRRGKVKSSAEQFLAAAREAGLTNDSGMGDTRQVKVVLLENIHPRAIEIFEDNNFRVESHSSALSGQELIDVAADCHILGIRSKTKLTQEFFDVIGEQATHRW